jgi:hypothetical protein
MGNGAPSFGKHHLIAIQRGNRRNENEPPRRRGAENNSKKNEWPRMNADERKSEKPKI